RGVLGRQAEGVPSHRLQHVEAAHAVVAGENVADGIVPDVSHVQLPRGIRERAQAVELRRGGVFFDAVGARRCPVSLGAAVDVPRAPVKLGDGSLVKLGENGQLGFAELSPAVDLFKAALNVLEGAFRFTTDLVAKSRKREVSIRAAQVTAGIRGTDLWGRSRQGNEIVCLIEGEIEVVAEGEPAVSMNQPLQFYRRIEGKAQPIGTVEKAQLE